MRTNCDRSESDESEKLGIFGASSLDAAIDAAVIAANFITAAKNLTAWIAPETVANETFERMAIAMACGMLNFPSGFDARKRPKNKPVLRDESRRHAEANPERHAAPGLLSYDVATPGQLRRDAVQP